MSKNSLRFVPFAYSSLLLAGVTMACGPEPTGPAGAGTGGGAALSSGGASSGSGGGLNTGGSDLGATGGALSSGGAGEASSGGAGATDPGSGGSGADSGGNPGAGGSTELPPEAIIFQEDFEAAAEDSVPTGWDSFVAYVVNMSNTKASEAYALADSSKAHGGSKSLHVLGGQSPAMLTRPLPQGTTKIYMRSYVWLTASLGQSPDRNHETLIGVRGTPGGASDEVRFGEIKGVIGTNEVPSDNISPVQAQWGKGPMIPAGEWNCIEVAFVGDAAPHSVQAWNNGTELHLVNDPSQWQNAPPLSNEFLTGKFKEFIIGWQSFSNYANEIWFDDIVVATERVGCN